MAAVPRRRRRSLHSAAPLHSAPPLRSVRYKVHDTVRRPEDVESAGYERLLRKFGKAPVSALDVELVRASNHGNHAWTYELVRMLVHDRGEEPKLRHYVALILANTDPVRGFPEEVERLLREMVDEGVNPDATVYHAALKVLAIHPSYTLRTAVLSELERRWFSLTAAGWHHLVCGLLRERQVELALDRLGMMEEAEVEPRPWLVDLLIYTLVGTGDFDHALKGLELRAMASGSAPSSTLWAHFLSAAARALHHPAVSYIWRQQVEPGYLNPSTGLCTAVLDTAARAGDSGLATDVFRVLGTRSSPLTLYQYEALVDSYLAAPEPDLAAVFSILTVMSSGKENGRPTDGTARTLFLYLRGQPPLARRALSVLEARKDQGHDAPVPAVNAVLEAAIHNGDLAFAISTYKFMHTLCPAGPTTATFNALLRGCSKAARKDLAMFLASEMLALRVAPDALTYDRLMLVCLDGPAPADLDDAWRYLAEMKGRGWWPRRGTLVTLCKRACQAGDPRLWELLDEMESTGLDAVPLKKWCGARWREPPRPRPGELE